MSKTGNQHVLSRLVTGVVVTACAASALWAAGVPAAPDAGRAVTGGRAAVARLAAEAPAAKEEARVTKIFSRPDVDWINFAIELDTANNGNDQNGIADTSWYGSTFTSKVLINGKRMSEWGQPAIDIHKNITVWGDLSGALKDPATGETLSGERAADTAKNLILFNFNRNQLNFVGDGHDIVTICKDFPSDSPANYRFAAQAVDGNDPRRREIQEPNAVLDREINLRVIPSSDGRFYFEEVDRRIEVVREVSFASDAAQAEKAGADWQYGDLVSTTYAGNANPDTLTFRTRDDGTLQLLNAGEDAHNLNGEGWTSFDAGTAAGCQRSLSFWIYSTMTQDELRRKTADGIELSQGEGPDAEGEYQWNATDIFFHYNYRVGMWNRVVMKLREPSASGNGATAAFDALRWFRNYYNFYLYNADGDFVDAEGNVVTDPVQDPRGAEKGIYFSDIRLIESPANAGVVEQAKVKQYVEPSCAGLAVGGGRTAIDLGLTTRLRGTPGVEERLVTLVSSDPTALTVEFDDAEGRWYATALKPGAATLSARIPGDERYAESTQTFSLNAAKAAQATLTITSPATGEVGAAYTLATAGGSGTGAVTYTVVSGPATAEGDRLNFTAGGTVVVKAAKAGDADYEAAESAEFTITVTAVKENQTDLIIDSPDRGYLGSVYTLTYTGGSGTGAVTYTLVSGPAELNGDQLTFTGEGEVVVKVEKAGDDDYNAAASPAYTITVSKGVQQTLSVASAAEGTYGSAYTLATAGGSGTGAVTYTVVSGPATAEGDRLIFARAGTVVVKAVKAGDETYQAAESAEFTITVAKAAITVKVQDYNVIVGTSLPGAYSFTVVSGTLAEGDTIELQYSTEADIAKVGEYDVTATAAESDQYEITVQKGKITVKAAGGGTEDKGGCAGCKSALGAGSAIAGLAALCAATGILFARKRKRDRK